MRMTRGLAGWLMVCIAAPASSQVFYGVSGGFGFAGPGTNTPGFLAQASFGQVNSRASGWRLDAFALGGFQGSYSVFIPSICNANRTECCVASGPSGPQPCAGVGTTSQATAPVGIAGLALSGIIPLHHSADGVGTYALAGGELDHLTGGQPGTPRNLVFGWSPGVGIALAPEGRRRTFVEARFRGLVNSGGLPNWTFLVSAGFEWSATKR